MIIPTDVRKLYEDDELSLRQIARQLGTNHQTISEVLDSLGVRRRPTGWSRNHASSPYVGWPNRRVVNARRQRDTVQAHP